MINYDLRDSFYGDIGPNVDPLKSNWLSKLEPDMISENQEEWYAENQELPGKHNT